MRCKCKRKCKRKRRSHVDRKCKEGKICRRSQAQSKSFFKMADDSEALVAISLLFVVFLYRVLKGWRIKTYPEVPHLLLHLSKQKSSSVYFWIVYNFYHITLDISLHDLPISRPEWKTPSFFQICCPVMAWNRWNFKKLFVLYLCICIYFCVTSVYTYEMQTQAQEHEFFFISFVCVCICVDVVHTYIS